MSRLMCRARTMQVCFKSTRNMPRLSLALKLFVAYFLGQPCAEIFLLGLHSTKAQSAWPQRCLWASAKLKCHNAPVSRVYVRGRVLCVCVCILESAVQLARRKSEHTYTHTHRHAYYKCLSVWHSTFLYAVHINCIIYVTFMLASRSLAYTLSLSFLFSLSPMALPLTHSDCRWQLWAI